MMRRYFVKALSTLGAFRRSRISQGFVDVMSLLPDKQVGDLRRWITLPLRSTLITRASALRRVAPPLAVASVFFLMVLAISE
jgi:hypothetical protein